MEEERGAKRHKSEDKYQHGGVLVPPTITAPVGTGNIVALPADPHVERLRKHQVWQIAYMRDVTRVLHHSIAGRGLPPMKTMVGRAHTVDGPDIYLNALESIKAGQVYVQGGCNDRDAVFSPGWTHAYLATRGAVGVVVDGGVYKSFECKNAAVPMFSKFVSPSPAINRKETGAIGCTVVVGGVSIKPGDIIMGDADGVICIPQECEADLFANLDGFIEGNGAFGKIAGKALSDGIPMTEHPALAAMFEYKYAHPENYWRLYEKWWSEQKEEYGHLVTADNAGTVAFYSGAEKDHAKT
eukprot:m.137655 g.137655  ORF g.137655 m.137655 type:complete len:298 (+) comp14757_c1_seq3:76-969(+)